MNTHIIRLALMTGACGLALAAPAAGQAAPADEGDDVIIVTAQNRAENVQDVPIAISVVGGEALKESGVTDFTAIQRVAPAVQIVSDTVQTRITVRGIGSNSNDEAQDQAVAVNIDGEYLNRPTVLNASLFDLDRVEVLRGPQGTLYGRNATGGAINFITRKPGKDFGVNASASYGNYNHLILEGGIDLPLGEIAAVRASGIYSKRDGFNFHPNVNKSSGDDDTKGGRLSLRLEPADGLRIDAAVERVEIDVTVPVQAWVDLTQAANQPGVGCANAGWADIAPALTGDYCAPVATTHLRNVNRSTFTSPSTGVGWSKAESTVVRGRIAYDFDAATLTYSVGARSTDRTSAVTLSPAYVFLTYQDDVDTQSHEVRLNGDTGPLTWQLGGFYFKEKQKIDRGLFRAGLPAFLLGANGGYINYFRRPFVNAESWAVFGQTDIALSDTLTAVVGARYTDDSRKALYENLGGGIGNPNSPLFNTGQNRVTVAATPAQTLNLRADASKFTWVAGLNYKPNADTLVYGKIATGFKAGGFDAVGVYAPESNTSYEVGTKLNFGADSRNIFNLAAFYNDYKDLQVSVLIDNTKGGQIFNAGKAVIWGIEAEAEINLSRTDTFTASVNYLNAEYKKLLASIPVYCVGCSATAVSDLDTNAATITQPNLAGNTPPMSPAWTITLGYQKEIPLGEVGSLTANVFTTFKTSYFTDIFNFNDSRQEGFSQTDFSLTYEPRGKAFSVQAFLRNAENNRPLTYGGFTAAGNDRIYNWQFGAPRTYGVRVSVDF